VGDPLADALAGVVHRIEQVFQDILSIYS
jgi:hypothetical protein